MVSRILSTRRVMHMAAGAGASSLLKGITAYFKMEETSGTRADEVNGWQLTDNNTVTSGTGIIGTSAQFSRANVEYLSLEFADLGAGKLDGSGDFAVSLWFKHTVDFNTGVVLVGRWKTGDGSWILGTNSSNRFYTFTSSDGSSGGTSFSATSAWTTDTWYHLVLNYTKATENMKVYVDTNEVMDFTVNGSDLHVNASADLTFGNQEALGFATTGNIDEAALWGERVLTLAEITELYNGGAGVTYPFT